MSLLEPNSVELIVFKDMPRQEPGVTAAIRALKHFQVSTQLRELHPSITCHTGIVRIGQPGVSEYDQPSGFQEQQAQPIERVWCFYFSHTQRRGPLIPKRLGNLFFSSVRVSHLNKTN
jgi:hypothetical protein